MEHSFTRKLFTSLKHAIELFSGRLVEGRNNRIENAPPRLRTRIRIRGDNNRIIFGRNFRTRWLEIDVSGSGALLVIGDNCRLTGKIRLAGGGNAVTIGDETTAQDVYILADERKNVSIGKDCMISADVAIRTSDAHSILDAQTGKRTNLPQNIQIGDHVWIGMDALLMRGAEVANDCVIATRAVVNAPFTAPGCTIGGIPARVLSKGVKWDRRRL